MSKKLLFVWQCLFLISPIFALADQSSIPLLLPIPTPVQVVSAFQKFAPYEIDCNDGVENGTDAIKTGKKFESYLSKEFYKLFLWSQCGLPKPPPHYDDLRGDILWDFRYGKPIAPLGKMLRIRVRPATYPNIDQAVVEVKFDTEWYKLKNIKTTYTLIREAGPWKIDDIVPEGDDSSFETYSDRPLLEKSWSIKTDMQRNYNEALERYQKEQAAKGATPKP